MGGGYRSRVLVYMYVVLRVRNFVFRVKPVPTLLYARESREGVSDSECMFEFKCDNEYGLDLLECYKCRGR